MPKNPARAAEDPTHATMGQIDKPETTAIRSRHKSAPLTGDRSVVPNPSLGTRTGQRPGPPKINIIEGNEMMRSIDRPPPADVLSPRKSQLHPDVSKKKSSYFEYELAAGNRDPEPVRARVHNEAIVVAELRTNVIIKDEFSFITDLSYHLSNRYQRPMSSIVVNLKHGCCMMFGGSFDPAYTLTIHALPSLVQPTTNKRNALLIQRHMQESLGVVMSRGYLRFVATPEENVAIGGKTVAAEIEDSNKAAVGEKPAMSKRSTKSNRRLSAKSFGAFRSSVTDLSKVPTPPSSASEEITTIATIPEVPPTPPEEDKLGDLIEKKPLKTASRRKSLRFSLFGGKEVDQTKKQHR
ncbi:Tautomerase/MIF [Whalleya microplaca]|nr:Tautomerase/MIF [Whalleya microplaca]